MTYRVLIGDNFGDQRQDDRVTHGQFETAAEAIAACQSIVNEFLAGAYAPGMCATDLYGQYTGFGEDPFVVTVDPKAAPAVNFRAWAYALERCAAAAGDE